MESGDELDKPVRAVVTTESVGARLHAAREKAGLSIQDVAERTRVPARHLQSIETGNYAARHEGSGYYEGLPALAYSAGFVKAFADVVGLDGRELAAQYRAEAEPDPLPYYNQHEPLDPKRVPSAGLAWVAGGVGAVVVALLIAFSMGVFSSKPQEPVAEETPPPVASIPPQEDGVEPEAPAPAATAATPAAPGAPGAPAPAPAAATGQVVLSATEDAWIKVYDRSGQTVRMGILTAGENYPVPGDPNQLLLWTGKAGAIKVMVGGKPVAPLGKPVQTVRDVSLAPASLLARPMPNATPGGTPATGAAKPAATPAAGR